MANELSEINSKLGNLKLTLLGMNRTLLKAMEQLEQTQQQLQSLAADSEAEEADDLDEADTYMDGTPIT